MDGEGENEFDLSTGRNRRNASSSGKEANNGRSVVGRKDPKRRMEVFIANVQPSALRRVGPLVPKVGEEWR